MQTLRSLGVQSTRNKKDQWIDESMDSHMNGVYEWRSPSVMKLWYLFLDAIVRSRNSVRKKWYMSYEILVYLYVGGR